MLNKKCTNCEKTFYAIKLENFSKNFYRSKLGKYGFEAICKSCKKKLYQNKKTESKRVEKIKTCIVCSKVFDARRWVDTVCSKECSNFRTFFVPLVIIALIIGGLFLSFLATV